MSLALLQGTSPVRAHPFLPWPQQGEPEEKNLLDLLRTGSWGGYSPKVEEFGQAFAEVHRAKYGICCSNGTVALEVALRALKIGCGDEVIVPSISFVATAASVLLCHGCPVFVDVDPQTCTLLPEAVESAISPRTRAVIPVHFGGHPADMDAIGRIAAKHRIAIVEDAAHAHGAMWRDVPVGSLGTAAAFSFQAFKLVTAGEGGIVLTNSSSMAETIWSYCNQGRRKGMGWYEHFTLGTNYRMTGFQAAVLCAQLERLPAQIRKRTENVDYFRERLRSFHGISIPDDDPRVSRHPHYLVTMHYDSSHFAGLRRNLVIQALQAEGIPVLPTYPFPLYRTPLFINGQLPPCRCGTWRFGQRYESLRLEHAEWICENGMWLEQNVFLGNRNDIDDVLTAFEKVQRFSSALLDFQRSSQSHRA